MICPTCGAWSTVKETRGTRRRRECANGHRFTTTEVVSVEEGSPQQAQCQRAGRVREARRRLREMGYLA